MTTPIRTAVPIVQARWLRSSLAETDANGQRCANDLCRAKSRRSRHFGRTSAPIVPNFVAQQLGLVLESPRS
jgi:hypothetical protein